MGVAAHDDEIVGSFLNLRDQFRVAVKSPVLFKSVNILDAVTLQDGR